MRLNKFLADCGVASRRAADELIAAGAVTVDGNVATLGAAVDPGRSAVLVRGKPVAPPARAHVTLVLNKPAGVVTTMRDERGRKAVVDLLPRGRRLFPVGRLDADTSGLLLCTSDGALARLLTHPKIGVKRRYQVVARGELSAGSIRKLGAHAVRRLEDGAHSFFITLREGKNRQVRRMCAAQGLRVTALRRTQFGPVSLGGLAPGACRPLSAAERRALDELKRRALANCTGLVAPRAM